MPGVKNHRGSVTMMEDLTIGPNGGRGHHVRVPSNVAIEHGAGDAAGAGLLHSVRDVQEVGIVLRVRGVIRGPGQCARLVAVRCAASALSVLVISEKNYYYFTLNNKYITIQCQCSQYFIFPKPTRRAKKARTQFECLSVFGVYLCCLSSWKCLPSAD